MTRYVRPLVQLDRHRPGEAINLAGGWGWFDRVEVLSRTAAPYLMPASELTPFDVTRLSAPRPRLLGLDWRAPTVMGILNVTPDSFSDGGQDRDAGAAVGRAIAMGAEGADIIDIGGELTRPGAVTVPDEDEIDRTAPVIRALAAGSERLLSIDTRKSAVARAAVGAGAALINDVSGLTYDPAMAAVVAATGVPICVMHAQGNPETMQTAPQYDDVLLDVYDELERRIGLAEAAGIDRGQVIVDPGIGFGKTLSHNLALLRGLSLFHGLGSVVLLGASRKKFIGTISGAEAADKRMPGSVAVALAGIAQGVQMVRVHDVAETRQAISLFLAATGAMTEETP